MAIEDYSPIAAAPESTADSSFFENSNCRSDLSRLAAKLSFRAGHLETLWTGDFSKTPNRIAR
jgi:hypothetical protein